MTGKKLKANEMFQDIQSLWPTHLSTPPHPRVSSRIKFRKQSGAAAGPLRTARAALRGRGCPGGSGKTGLDPTCPRGMFLESPAISPAKTEALHSHPNRPNGWGYTLSYPIEAKEAKMQRPTPVLRTPVGKGPER